MSLEYPASGERQVRPKPVFEHNSSHVDDDIQISSLDVLCEMNGRQSRYIKEVLDWYREGDTGDLKRSELNELVSEHPRGKSWTSWKRNQKIVMNEEFVKKRCDQ